MANVDITANQIDIDDVNSVNNANLIINAGESLRTTGINLGNGNLSIHLDGSASTVGQVDITGNIIANTVIIDAQNSTITTLNDQLVIGGTIDGTNVQINDFSTVAINGDITLLGDLDIVGLDASIGADITANEITYNSQDASELLITANSIIEVNEYTNDVGIRGTADLELNLLNPSGAVNIDNIILTDSDLTLNVQNVVVVSVDTLGADSILITNNDTADLTVGGITDESTLNIDGFNDVTFTDNVLLASLDVNANDNITQTGGTSIEITDGILDLNAGGSIFVTQIESGNLNDNTVILIAGLDVVDVNDTQQDFIVDNANVLNISAIGNVPVFESSFDSVTPDPVVPDPVVPV